MEIAVVVPTIREDCIKRWTEQWSAQLSDASVIVVEDNPERSFDLPSDFQHYAWPDIEKDLGRDSWIIPRRTSAIKSYGFWKAYQQGAEIIWTLDDDCYPEPTRNYLWSINDHLTATVDQESWWNTLTCEGMYPRGYPYNIRRHTRPVMVHHGLWSNIPDLDGITQKDYPDFRLGAAHGVDPVPRGQFFPMCGMNLAWRREMTPAMYFMLMGQDAEGMSWGLDRFDDMFAGLFVKKIADHLDYAITSGSPSIHHAKASDVDSNIAKEAPGLAAYENLWKLVDQATITGTDIRECYWQLALTIKETPGIYWDSLAYAMGIWTDLF